MVTTTFSILILSFQIMASLSQTNYPSNLNLRLNKCLYNELGRMQTIHLPSTIMGNNENTSFPLQLKCATRLPHCLRPCSTEIFRPTISFPAENNPTTFYAHFTPSGFLRYGSHFYPPDEYCIFGRTENSVTIEICHAECGKTHVCVPKCCSADKVLDYASTSCQYSKTIWEPLVHKTENVQFCGEKRANIKFHYLKAAINCEPQAFFLRPVSGDLEKVRVRFRLLLDGSVVLRELLAKEWIRPEQGHYCLDGVQNFGNNIGEYTGDPLDQVLFICASDSLGTDKNSTVSSNRVAITGILYSILLFSGTPFLLCTVVVYILLFYSSTKQNVHGYTIFSHILAILGFYLFQGITNAVSRLYDSDDNASTSCMLIGIANHYFALASFCWMTIINYDLWSMFRYLKNTVGRSKGMKRFVVYSMLGWGIPFIAVFICVILDLKYGLYGDDGGECTTEIVVPLYGHKSCYIFEDSRAYFLFYPIGTLMTINIIFAGLTTYNMYNHNQSAKIAEKKSTKHKRMFSVWFKLFVVMGIALTSEVVVWSLKKKNETLPWYLIFPDIIAIFQAIAIFIIFACQRKIINQLHEGYPKLRPFLDKVLQLPCYPNPNPNTFSNMRLTPTPAKL